MTDSLRRRIDAKTTVNGVRLIASDLDGSLFGADHLTSPRSAAAVNAAIDAGLIFVAATGRSWFGGIERVTRLGARPDWFIGSNGGHRVNLHTDELEEMLTFDTAELTIMVDRCRSTIDGVGFGFELADGFAYDEQFLALHRLTVDGFERVSAQPFDGSDPDVLGPVGKLFVSDPSADPERLVEALRDVAPPGMYVTTSGIAFVEVTPLGADKGAALSRLCAKLGIDRSETVAFGDNYNDLTMLEWAGRGIAMGNAVDAAKATADEVTATNVEHGVAQVIEAILG